MTAALLLVVADYFYCNWTYPILDDSDYLAAVERFIHPRHYEDDATDLYGVDVAYSRQLVPAVDDLFGIDTIGTTPITDRRKLLDYLSRIEGADYKMLFLDIRFESKFTTDVDSALFSLLSRLPRVVVATHAIDGYQQIDNKSLCRVSAAADYHNWLNKPFSRYELIQSDMKSVPLVCYNVLAGRDITSHAVGYTDGGRLCNNSMFVPLPLSAVSVTPTVTDEDFVDEDYDEAIGDMGQGMENCREKVRSLDLLLDIEPEYLQSQVSDKIVIIGDYQSDVHSTYIGNIPGPLINYYAYRALADGRHLVNWWIYLILFAVYTTICYKIIHPAVISASDTSPHPVGTLSRFLGGARTLMVSFFGWGSVLLLTKLLLYYFIGELLNITVPMLLFSSLNAVKKYITT